MLEKMLIVDYPKYSEVFIGDSLITEDQAADFYNWVWENHVYHYGVLQTIIESMPPAKTRNILARFTRSFSTHDESYPLVVSYWIPLCRRLH